MFPRIEQAKQALIEFKQRNEKTKGDIALDGALAVVDEVLKLLNDGISRKEMKDAIVRIETFKVKSSSKVFALMETLPDALTMRADEVTYSRELQICPYTEPKFNFNPFTKIKSLASILKELHQVLILVYDNLTEYQYTSDQIHGSQEFNSYLSSVIATLKLTSKSGLDDFKRDVTVEGLDLAGKNPNGIEELLQSYAGSTAKTDFLSRLGGQKTSYLPILELLSLLKTKHGGNEIGNGIDSGHIHWSKDAEGNLIGDFAFNLHTLSMLGEEAGFEMGATYVLNEQTHSLRKVDNRTEEHLLQKPENAKEIASPKIASMHLRIKVCEPVKDELVVSIENFSYQFYTHDLTHKHAIKLSKEEAQTITVTEAISITNNIQNGLKL